MDELFLGPQDVANIADILWEKGYRVTAVNLSRKASRLVDLAAGNDQDKRAEVEQVIWSVYRGRLAAWKVAIQVGR
ncbi:MAG: hypothetical protein QW100_02365 [Thermoplasmatales archaeon]